MLTSLSAYATPAKVQFYQLSNPNSQISAVSQLVQYPENTWQVVSPTSIDLKNGTNWLAIDIDHGQFTIDSLYLKDRQEYKP